MSSTSNEITPRAIYSYYELISRSKCLNGVNHLTCSSTLSSECHLFKKKQKTLCDPLTCTVNKTANDLGKTRQKLNCNLDHWKDKWERVASNS